MSGDGNVGPPVTELKVEDSLESANYDALVLVVSPDQQISCSVLSSTVSSALEFDSALKTEVGVLSVQLPAKRLVYSPTGPLDPDYDDARIFKRTAAAGIKRALKAGSKKPLLVLEKNNFKNGQLVALLGALETLYTAVADWKSKTKGKAADVKKALNKTGGGRPQPPLNDNERRLMAIIGWSVTGTNTAELGFDTEINLFSPPRSPLRSPLGTPPRSPLGTPPRSPLGTPPRSPPPLCYLNSTESTLTESSNQQTTPLNNTATPSKPLQKQKRKVLSATRKGSATESRFRENIATQNMQQMHSETLDVLKEINGNLGRMADIQEKICSILEVLVAKNSEVEHA